MATPARRIRQPAVAGTFYPAEPRALQAAVRRCFQGARSPAAGAPVPAAIVVPHAGYVFSGPIAASAYSRLAPAAARLRRVVLLGPSHFAPLDTMAVSGADAFASPFGVVAIDEYARRTALGLPGVMVDDAPHATEHSLEVQLPFLQTVLEDFELLPVAVGHCPSREVAAMIGLLWGEPETVVIVSTDLSHYLPYALAQTLDQRTAAAVTALEPDDIGDGQACGAHALRGVLVAARAAGLTAELLDLRNSGDTAGGRDRVVGYGAFTIG